MTKEIEIKIEGKEWKDALDKAFNEKNKKAKIDGFRPGKAPKDVFIKHYGIESLYMDAGDLVLEKAYSQMLEEAKDILENVVARPDIALKGVDEDHIEFKFILTLKPEVKLGKYKGLSAKKEEVTVSEDEVNEVIKNMQSRYAEDVLKEGKIENGDEAIIDFDGSVDGVNFDGGKAENYSLKIGSGTFIPGFEDQLIGLSAGDEKDVVVTFPEDYHAEELKGKEAVFKVKVHEVKEVKLPELDEEFFADLAIDGVDSKESLIEKVKEDLQSHKDMDAENKYVDALLDEACENMEVEVPEVMIEEEKDRMVEQYSQNLGMQGISLEQFYQFTGSDENTLRNQMTEEATKRVKCRLMLEEIAKQENIEISEEDAQKEAEKLAERYQMDIEEFLKAFGGTDMVKYDLKMRRAMEILKED